MSYTVVNDYDSYSDSDEDSGPSSTSISNLASSRETRDTKDNDAVMFADSVGGVSDQIVLVKSFL